MAADTYTLSDDAEWPPELMQARREYRNWSPQQLLIEQRESTPTEPLFHYTDEAGLRGILTTQQFWTFSHLHQTDPSEFEYALGIARRVLTEIGQSKEFFTHFFCACLVEMLEVNAPAGPFDFYLFSLSRHRDHAPQWQAYGQNGRGYAIGLSPALFQPDKADLYEDANKNLHVGRVIYGDELTAARHRLTIVKTAEITSRIGNAHPDAVREFTPSRYLAKMAQELLASQLIWNCLTAKHIRYEDEREVRGIILNVKSKFDPWRRTRAGRDYVEHALPLTVSGSITEILVGPDAPPDAEASVRAILATQGYPDTIPVGRSSAGA
jgi:Protein of unknown function (DUF2971)